MSTTGRGLHRQRLGVERFPQREEKKALSPLSKAEHLRRRRGFYPLSILCLIRSAKITASAMIECRAANGLVLSRRLTLHQLPKRTPTENRCISFSRLSSCSPNA